MESLLAQPWLRWSLTATYLLVLALISVYGLHRYFLVMLYWRYRNAPVPSAKKFAALPRVTVQLPVYNEAAVVERIIDAACNIDYPPALLEVQVLDDSTDDCKHIAAQRCQHWRDRGVDIAYVHRADREGYKAGALANGLAKAKGDFIAIFDADFVPPRGFLRDAMDHFADDSVGMVQARWGHLNRDNSLLTQSQAIFLDGHFIIEHAARHRSGRWINFNGTAGVWRREAIDQAGGWQHDTLTEDMDLSYRSQLAGWRFVFLPDVVCPAELPPEINAFKAQQHRWSKGSIQTAIKLLPTLLRSDANWRVKLEAMFHLTGPMVYVYVTALALLFYPAFYVNMRPTQPGAWAGVLLGLTLFSLGTASAGVFYVVSQKAQGLGLWRTLVRIPLLMSIGIGIAVNNSRGCIEALLGQTSGFERTPKYNQTEKRERRPAAHVPSIKLWMILLELGMAAYTLNCAHLSLNMDAGIVSFPFLLLFASGYFYVGIQSLASLWQTRRSPNININPARPF